jgi:hypothetical protein
MLALSGAADSVILLILSVADLVGASGMTILQAAPQNCDSGTLESLLVSLHRSAARGWWAASCDWASRGG